MNGIAKRRLELGLTQPDLSEIIKRTDARIDVPMLSRFERGVCLPTPPVLEALEQALQASRSELLSEYEEVIPQGEEDAGPPVFSPMTEKLQAAIPFGRKNAMSRTALAIKMGLTDRGLRKAIEIARREGLLVMNASDGAGYFQSVDLDDVQRQYWQDTARAMTILARRKQMRRMLKEAGRAV